jgi:16S rRNA (guanine527-N7)-methyltransferase
MKRFGILASDTDFALALRQFLDSHGLPISDDAIARCTAHFVVLCRWNRVMNLVGDLTLDSAVRRHYGESVFLAAQLPVGTRSILDFGSGAGFPGAIVAACRPDVEVHLAESREKRAAFLSEATRGWTNCRVHSMVAEKAPFLVDVITSRAVAWDAVAGLASRAGSGVQMLVGSGDVQSIASGLERQGFFGSCRSVPWRQESSVLSFSRVR